MNWSFPEIKTTRNTQENIQKIKDEILEFEEANNDNNRDEEAVDILHTAETLLRKLFKGREDKLDEIIKKVIEKNTKRKYYSEECF